MPTEEKVSDILLKPCDAGSAQLRVSVVHKLEAASGEKIRRQSTRKKTISLREVPTMTLQSTRTRK